MNKLKKILCYFNIHDWEINLMVDSKGKISHFIITCNTCDKCQKLQRTKEYSPAKWVFRD